MSLTNHNISDLIKATTTLCVVGCGPSGVGLAAIPYALTEMSAVETIGYCHVDLGREASDLTNALIKAEDTILVQERGIILVTGKDPFLPTVSSERLTQTLTISESELERFDSEYCCGVLEDELLLIEGYRRFTTHFIEGLFYLDTNWVKSLYKFYLQYDDF